MEDLPEPRIPQGTFAKRRARIAKQLGDGEALVVATHAEALHSNDVYHRFRPHNDFWYLTGFREPRSVLVLLGGSGESHLFLNERDPKQEIWTGRRLGVERAKDAVGVDHAHGIEDIRQKLPGIVKGCVVRTIMDHDPKMEQMLRMTLGETENGETLLAEARCIKDANEIKLMQAAADAAIAGHLAAYPAMQAGQNERHAEAAFLHAIRESGSEGPGYPPIVGAGENAAVLHYIDNGATITKGDMVLMDAGAEWGYYNSDITRTVPSDGEWSNQDRDLYALVLAAQDAAIAEVRPGNKFRAPHDAAVRVLADGLAGMGFIDKDLEDAQQAVAPFFMHGTSHFLGLDVHDPGWVRDGKGGSRILEPGMVLTVEPGLYFNPEYASIPKGITPKGIRIENDLVVTEDGFTDLTRGLARDLDEVAALVNGD